MNDDIIFDTDSSDCDNDNIAAMSNSLKAEDESRLIGAISTPVGLSYKPLSSSLGAMQQFLGSEIASQSFVQEDDHDADIDEAEDVDDRSLLEATLLSIFESDAASSTSTSPVFAYLLRTYCNIKDGTLRSGQEEVIRNILAGRSTLALFPTGWGKSLCYQLPMLVHRLLHDLYLKREVSAAAEGKKVRKRHRTNHHQPALEDFGMKKFAVVVSPLLALIADQIGHIKRLDNISAVALTSRTGKDQEDNILKTLADPVHGNIDVVFVSPETFVTKRLFRSTLASSLERIAFVCVDEAHCISEWSHDFRPTFLYIRRALQDLVEERRMQEAASRASGGPFGVKELNLPPLPPILALTATATDSVKAEICTLLGIQQQNIVDRLVARSNLTLECTALEWGSESPSERQRLMQQAIYTAVSELVPPILIYTPTQVLADELSLFLRNQFGGSILQRNSGGASDPMAETPNVLTRKSSESMMATALGVGSTLALRHAPLRVATYHAGLPQAMRSAAQRDFLADNVDVLVATIAFGMGIDKPNIRSVVHCNLPSSLGSYSQESGRAGRDGLPSRCRVVYAKNEFYTLRRKAMTHILAFPEVKDIVTKIFASPTTVKGSPDLFMLVSAEAIAGELTCAVESVETILFSILNSHPNLLRSLSGKSPSAFSVSHLEDHRNEERGGDQKEEVKDEVDRESGHSHVWYKGSAYSTAGDTHTKNVAAAYMAQRRRDQSRRYQGSLQGILHQLDVDCEVTAMLRVNGNVANVIHAANSLSMSLEDFQFRLKQMEESKTARFRWRNWAHLIVLGSSFPPTAEMVSLIAKEVYHKLRARMMQKIKQLETMFAFFDSPSQERLVAELRGGCGQLPLSIPQPKYSLLQAVDIVEDFVRENRSRIQSAHEAAKALVGIAPAVTNSGAMGEAFAPLTGSWYVKHSKFGILEEFDFDVVMRLVSAHGLT